MAITGRHLIAAVFFMMSGWVAWARPQGPLTPPRQVSFQFTVFALGGMTGISFEPETGAGTQALRFYSAYRSPKYHYTGPEQMRFWAQRAGGGEPMVVAVYTVPEGARNLLLLFFPRETPSVTGLKYDVRGVDDSVEATPAGCFSTVNLSGREYAGHYGAEHIMIPPGAGPAHEAKGRVKLLLAAQVDGAWMSAGRHEFSMGARDRVTLVFYPPASATSIYPVIRRLIDTLPPPEKKPGEKGANTETEMEE